MNKKILFAGALLAGLVLLKKKIPFEPKVPVVDDKTILLYQLEYSPYCIKVQKIMDYKGIPYKTVNLLPLIQKKHIKNISGQGLVPVIQHSGKTVYDSTFIAKYLEEIVPEPSIYLKDEKANNDVLLMEDWADEAFETPLGRLVWIYISEHPEIILEEGDVDTGIPLIDNNKEKIAPLISRRILRSYGVEISDKDILKKRARESLDILSEKLENNKFLVGDTLTIADITVASHLTVARRIPYIYEDDTYAHIFAWQKDIFNACKRRVASTIS